MSVDAIQLSCAEVEPLLPLVAEGVLEPSNDPRLFAHLAVCCECQEALARHDLITLAISKRPQAPANIQHIRIPAPWAVAAAAGVAGACLFGYWTHGGAKHDSMLAQHPDRTVIRIERPGPPGSKPLYLVVDGERKTLIDPQHIDHDVGAVRSDAVPVRY